MTTITTLALIAHVLIAATIIGLVLLQRGKGAEAGAGFGAGASGTVFGAKGSANFLSRSTAVLAALFYFSSLGLAYLGANQPVTRSLLEDTQPAGIGISNSQPGEEGTVESNEALPALPELEGFGEEELPLEPGAE